MGNSGLLNFSLKVAETYQLMNFSQIVSFLCFQLPFKLAMIIYLRNLKPSVMGGIVVRLVIEIIGENRSFLMNYKKSVSWTCTLVCSRKHFIRNRHVECQNV